MNGDERAQDPAPERAGRGVGRLADAVEAAHRFAARSIGPESARWIATPEASVQLTALLEEGRNVEDAVLGVVFREVRRRRPLADEFFGYFFGDLFHTGSSLIDPRVRGLMETGELVDSVVRDLWVQLDEVEFRTRGQFLSFLLRKMRWKKLNNIKQAQRSKRGAQGVAPQALPMAEVPDSGRRTPLSEAEHTDDLKRLAKLALRLPEAERQMLHLRIVEGLSYAEIGARHGLSANSAKKRIQDLKALLRGQF